MARISSLCFSRAVVGGSSVVVRSGLCEMFVGVLIPEIPRGCCLLWKMCLDMWSDLVLPACSIQLKYFLSVVPDLGQ